MTDQYKLTSIVCARPQQFAWFLGAGASAAAGLPTAWDVIWDLKRRYYRREENQDISRQDMQLDAVRARVQSYILSRGFPEEGDPSEYTTYFEKAFGDDKEKQRRYLAAFLSEEKVTLSIGNRVLGALFSSGSARSVFTTNFDTVVERAVAEVSGRSLAAFHLEGAASANKAISNEEYPPRKEPAQGNARRGGSIECTECSSGSYRCGVPSRIGCVVAYTAGAKGRKRCSTFCGYRSQENIC